MFERIISSCGFYYSGGEKKRKIFATHTHCHWDLHIQWCWSLQFKQKRSSNKTHIDWYTPIILRQITRVIKFLFMKQKDELNKHWNICTYTFDWIVIIRECVERQRQWQKKKIIRKIWLKPPKTRCVLQSNNNTKNKRCSELNSNWTFHCWYLSKTFLCHRSSSLFFFFFSWVYLHVLLLLST